MNYQWQTPNNCGPASVAILLGYYGHWVTQQQVNERLPAGSVENLESYLSQYQLMARAYSSPPSNEPVRLLLANGIPVIVNQRLSSDSNIRHYRVIRGYDDAAGEFISDDSLLGPDFRITYHTFTVLSRRGEIIPVYPSKTDPLVKSLMRSLSMRETPV